MYTRLEVILEINLVFEFYSDLSCIFDITAMTQDYEMQMRVLIDDIQ